MRPYLLSAALLSLGLGWTCCQDTEAVTTMAAVQDTEQPTSSTSETNGSPTETVSPTEINASPTEFNNIVTTATTHVVTVEALSTMSNITVPTSPTISNGTVQTASSRSMTSAATPSAATRAMLGCIQCQKDCRAINASAATTDCPADQGCMALRNGTEFNFGCNIHSNCTADYPHLSTPDVEIHCCFELGCSLDLHARMQSSAVFRTFSFSMISVSLLAKSVLQNP